VLQCNAVGDGYDTVEDCTLKGKTCFAGECAEITCGNGKLEPEKGEECDDANAKLCDGCESCQRRMLLNLKAKDALVCTPAGTPKSSKWTLELWVKFDSLPSIGDTYHVASRTDKQANPHLTQAIDLVWKDDADPATSGFRFRGLQNANTWWTTTSVTSKSNIKAGTWNHVAFSHDSTYLWLWVNGQPEGVVKNLLAVGTYEPSYSCLGNLYPGTNGHQSPLGYVDEVRLSSSVRYSRPFQPERRYEPDADTLALWHFDEGIGATAADATGNGHVVSVTGSAAWAVDDCYGAAAGGAACNDGVKAPWEECDDGNKTAGDGCSASCTIEVDGVDCLQIFENSPATPDGIYTVDPDLGGPKKPLDVFCNMTMVGGGWTLVAVSSDDGQHTWTWNNRHYWDTDTTTFGKLDELNRDFKSGAYHDSLVSEVLFLHYPSKYWAHYGVNSYGQYGMAARVGSVSPYCGLAANTGFSAKATKWISTPSICDNKVYFNPQDSQWEKCADLGDIAHTWGPAWNVKVGSSNCLTLVHPGLKSSLGPNSQYPAYEYSPNQQTGAIGFGAAAQANTGQYGKGENYMQIYVR